MKSSAEQTSVRLDSRQIRVLAHPLRARLLGQLRLDGPATATRLAEVLETNTGATSYHLRQLAEVGLVRPDDRPAQGRQRWWRAAHDMTSWWHSDFAADPDATAAADWLTDYSLMRLVESAQRWLRAAGDEPQQWQDAADLSDYTLWLDAGRLRELTADLHEVVKRHLAAGAGQATPGTRQIRLHVYAFPRVGP